MVIHISFNLDGNPSLNYSRHFWFPDTDGQKLMDILDKYENMEINIDKKNVQSLSDKQKNRKTHSDKN